MILLVAMKQARAGIVSHELDLPGGMGIDQHDIFHHTQGPARVAELKGVTMQV